MRIVYDDYGGAHSTQVAAGIHLGKLPTDRVATAAELMALPMFDRTTNECHGCLMYIGTDEQGHEVYVLGRGPGGVNVERAIASGFVLADGDQANLRFFDTLPCVNWWMRIGGFLSRALRLVTLGRPLVIFGTRKAYLSLIDVVKKAKEWADSAGAQGTMGIQGSDGTDMDHLARSCRQGTMPQ